MTITDILTPERVIPELTATTKDAVLDELANLLVGQIPQATPARLVAVLRERERLNSTAIGDGIAIPHGRLSGTKSVVAGFARSTAGVDFDSVDRQPTHLFFVLIAPDDAAAMHLKALARISRLLRDQAVCAKLRGTDRAEALYALLTDRTASHAA